MHWESLSRLSGKMPTIPTIPTGPRVGTTGQVGPRPWAHRPAARQRWQVVAVLGTGLTNSPAAIVSVRSTPVLDSVGQSAG